LWPETVIFWGAGATRALFLRTTAELGQAVYQLANQGEPLTDRVARQFSLAGIAAPIGDLFTVLSEQDDCTSALTRLFPAMTQQERYLRREQLRRTYDWATLCQLVHVCPGHSAEDFRLQDLFTLLDMHIESHHGFYVEDLNGNNRQFVPPEYLLPARNALVMLIGLLHYHDFHCNLATNTAVFAQYIEFAGLLARLMLEEGQRLSRQTCYDDRAFYLFSYAVISMNWDPILLWLLFNAHNQVNDCPAEDAISLKLFQDFSHFMGLRQVDGKTPRVWYPLNESVVQRLNDAHSGVSCRVRIGKYYMPHGCSGWRECPNCGKLTLYLGNEWCYDSTSLYPPPLINALSENWRQPRSHQEQAAHDRGCFDALQCAYCGALTELKHTPLVMQTGFKGRNAAFVEEIHHDMRIALENAEHVVLMGYTLPPDDGIYRSVLAARQKRGMTKRPCCSVIVGQEHSAPDQWLTGQHLDDYIQQNSNSSFARTIRAAQEIFDPDQVRGYARGIPEVFLGHDGHASYEKVRELLYPIARFPGHQVQR
jgi:hypothetical protein